MSDCGFISFTDPNIILILEKPGSTVLMAINFTVLMAINFTWTISQHDYKTILGEVNDISLLFHS